MDRRGFLEALAVAAAAGLPIASRRALAGDGEALYDIPRFGRVSLLHMTDCHAQLMAVRFREPDVNIGVGEAIDDLLPFDASAYVDALFTQRW